MIHSPALMELTNSAEEPQPLDWEINIRRVPKFHFNYTTLASLNDTEEGFGEEKINHTFNRALKRNSKIRK